jgi:hypothetical protein
VSDAVDVGHNLNDFDQNRAGFDHKVSVFDQKPTHSDQNAADVGQPGRRLRSEISRLWSERF